MLDGEQPPQVQTMPGASALRPFLRLASFCVPLARSAGATRFHAAFDSAGKIELANLLVAGWLAALPGGFVALRSGWFRDHCPSFHCYGRGTTGSGSCSGGQRARGGRFRRVLRMQLSNPTQSIRLAERAAFLLHR